MHSNRIRTSCTLALVTVVAATSGCVRDKIVYRDGLNFTRPQDAARGFVGYANEATKQTVCGSCHVEMQARWKETAHADAWKSLQESGSSQSYCYGCHTTGGYGNVENAPSGYTAVADARYHDVQCENCHGAGFTHISAPNTGNRPLASIAADTGLKYGCGECHTGVHDPFVEEWKRSGHAKSFETSHNSTDPSCQGCHTAQGALASWGVTNNYVEKESATKLDVNCATCHDPHGSSFTKQLRFSITAANLDDNLCIRCHQRRATPAEVTTRNSVHSPEGPTLLGTAGWFPPGMSVSDSLYGSHGSTRTNPKLCATCHVARFTVNDKATGKFLFQVTGHRFLAIPCVDGNGQPTDNQNCDVSARTFRSCVASGCHGTEASARAAFTTAEARMTLLEGQLNSQITQQRARQASTCTLGSTYTVCLGAAFNLNLAQRPGSAVHNPFLVEQLLINSINAMRTTYGVAPTMSEAELRPMFSRNHPFASGGGGR